MYTDVAIQRLRRAFGLGLGFVAVVVIAAQVIVAQAPSHSAVDVRIVDLAGRQCMLSQRITKTALLIHDRHDPAFVDARAELDAALTDFVQSHHALLYGDPERGLPGENSVAVIARFEDIDPWFRDVASIGEALFEEPVASNPAQRLLPELLNAEHEFLPRMNAIVDAYEREATARVKTFRDLETLILTVTFLSLVGIALGIIRPVIRNVETEMRRRRSAETKLLDQADELRDTARAAEAASRAKARFLASMSHEMRTPLNGIVGMAQVLEDSDLDGEQRADLEVIQSSSQALLALISDVLDLAKIEAERLHFESVPFDLHTLATETVRIIGPAAQDKGIGARTEIDPATPSRVLGDPTRIRQVLLNLLSNAVKFTSDGEVTLRVRMPATASGGQATIRFEVIDTGIGIDPDQKQRLFQPFTQVDDSTTRRFGGTGLGLAISRHLVDGMGGDLDFTSGLGRGSTFHFELRLDVVEDAAEDTAAAQSTARHLDGETPSLSVLLVDDLPVNRLVARKLLVKLGHRVDEATDGLEAVAAVEKTAYDVVLMDLQMPNLDGLGATARIRALQGDRARTPIVALTADALAGDRERVLDAGLDDYLSKPLARTALVETLRRVTAAPPAPVS